MRGAFSWAAGCRCTEVTTEPLAGSPEAVLRFWFDECRPAQWFRRSQAFDQTIQSRFGGLVEAALEGNIEHWSDSALSGLASFWFWISFRGTSGGARPRRLQGMLRHWP